MVPYASGDAVRVTVEIDEDALAAAMKMSPGRSESEVVDEALREYARRRRLRGFLEFEGKLHWEGDLDRLRKRDRAFE